MKAFLFILATVLAFGQTVNAAESQSIQGTIASVNANEKSITVTPSDATQGLPQQVNLVLKDENALQEKGINSLDELSVGDEISVEAEQKEEGKYEVKSITSILSSQSSAASQESQAGVATENQSAQSQSSTTAGSTDASMTDQSATGSTDMSSDINASASSDLSATGSVDASGAGSLQADQSQAGTSGQSSSEQQVGGASQGSDFSMPTTEENEASQTATV